MDSLKIVFIAPYFLPYSSGGTEFYVLQLAKSLLGLGVAPSIMVVNETIPAQSYHYKGIAVQLFASKQELLDSLITIKTVAPETILHLHSLDAAIDNQVFSFALQHFSQVFFTPHLVNGLCLNNGSLQYKDQSACNGVVLKAKCQSCISHRFNGFRRIFSNYYFQLIFQNALNLPFIKIMVSSFHFKTQTIKERIKLLSSNNLTIFALSHWYHQLLEANGIRRVHLLPQAVNKEFYSYAKTKQDNRSDNKVRWAFVGRLSPEKGIKELISVFKNKARQNEELKIFYIPSLSEKDFEREILTSVADDPRILLNIHITGVALAAELNKADCLVISSKVTEMAPLALVEAKVLGLPVLVSNFIKDEVECQELGLKFDYQKQGHFESQFVAMRNKIESKRVAVRQGEVVSFDDIASIHIQYYRNAADASS